MMFVDSEADSCYCSLKPHNFLSLSSLSQTPNVLDFPSEGILPHPGSNATSTQSTRYHTMPSLHRLGLTQYLLCLPPGSLVALATHAGVPSSDGAAVLAVGM